MQKTATGGIIREGFRDTRFAMRKILLFLVMIRSIEVLDDISKWQGRRAKYIQNPH
jgi:hypothetical protein